MSPEQAAQLQRYADDLMQALCPFADAWIQFGREAGRRNWHRGKRRLWHARLRKRQGLE